MFNKYLNSSLSYMDTYHYIDYFKEGLPDYIRKIRNNSHIICLDLEDSIQDVIHPENTFSMRERSRDMIRKILSNNIYENEKFALRINSISSTDFDQDIALLSEEKIRTKIYSLLLPKTESKKELIAILQILNDKKIEVEEIVLIMETGPALENINPILSTDNKRIKKIALGHCDLNLNMGYFPFQHQDSIQYWNWVKYLVNSAETSGIGFINSPFLDLNNDDAFNLMLSQLDTICSLPYAQCVLTSHQACLCSEFTGRYYSDNNFTSSKKDIILNEIELTELAIKIIKDYEEYNIKKGFTVTRSERVLISPHEYISAKNYLTKCAGANIGN